MTTTATTLYAKLPQCSNAALFRKRDEASRSVTIEEESLLYALVRMTKPAIAIETGTHFGASTERIVDALEDNGRGHLYSCDINPDLVHAFRDRTAGRPVTPLCCTGADLIRHLKVPADFVLIDSGNHHVRMDELRLLGAHNVAPMGIVAIHDICMPDYDQMYELFAERGWPHLIFPSRGGMAVFQRPENG